MNRPKNHRESKTKNNFSEKLEERHKVVMASWETFPNLEAVLSWLYTDNHRTRKEISETFPNVFTGVNSSGFTGQEGEAESRNTDGNCTYTTEGTFKIIV